MPRRGLSKPRWLLGSWRGLVAERVDKLLDFVALTLLLLCGFLRESIVNAKLLFGFVGVSTLAIGLRQAEMGFLECRVDCDSLLKVRNREAVFTLIGVQHTQMEFGCAVPGIDLDCS